eukprot:TRINITY_DN14634_c0_g1_i9.p1 TRINITY_DN14634_c0_g1~~TRINITY_DN14634_c0_g1_i9.p1  ORF type:complete len:110 (-),score=27.37 TRINITY_DN14634_c0_g1_i9:94-399(-)
MIRRPPRSTHCISSAASDVYKRQVFQERYCPILDRRRSGLATSIILSIGIMAVIVVGHLFSRRTERDAKQKHEKTGDEEEAAKRERKNKCQSMLKVQHKFE